MDRTHRRVEPFGAVEGQHTDRVMLLQSQLNEGLGRLMHLLLVLPARGNSIRVLNEFAWREANRSQTRNSLIGHGVVAVLAIFGT